MTASRVCLVAALSLAVAFVAGGCAADPCAGQTGACITLRVDGTSLPRIDALSVRVVGGGIDATRPSVHGAASLPVQLGIVVDPLATASSFQVSVIASASGRVVAGGVARTQLAPKQHVALDVTLTGSGIVTNPDMRGGGGGLTADRSSFDFGTVLSNAGSASAIFTITNGGSTASGALTTQLGGSSAADFTVDADGCSGQTLAAGASCTLSLHVPAAAPTTAMATLSVSGSPGGSATITLLSSIVAPGALAVSPATRSFDPVVVGVTGAETTFTVTNSGTAASGSLAVDLTGSDATHFMIADDGCSGKIVAGGASCSVGVRFVPSSAGDKLAGLRVSGMPGGIGVAELTGSGLAAAALSAPVSVDFSSVIINNTSAQVSLAIANDGSMPTGPLGVVLAGANASDFTIVSDGCSGSALSSGGAGCTVKMTFTPSASGARAAMLTVTATPGGSATIALTGTGLVPAAIAFSPTSGTFATTYVGQTSAGQTFTLTNNGSVATGPVTVTASGDFVLSNNGCNGNALPKSAGCMVTVSFKPTAFGARGGTLQATASPGGTTTASLSGSGLDQVQLDVTIAGAGSGSVSAPQLVCTGASCTGLYDRGSMVTLTATPGSKSVFTSWSGGCSGSGSCVVTMNMAKSVTATFTPTVEPLTITFNNVGGATGTINISTGGSCTATCTVDIPYNQVATLTPSPGAGFYFTTWGGDCSGATCQITASATHAVSVAFSPPNIAFVTSSTYAGNALIQHSTASIPDGLDGADQICKSLAPLGHPGTYIALLSRDAYTGRSTTFPAVNASDRLLGHSGWVRVDGKPVLQSPSDISGSAGRLFYPPRLDETGADVLVGGKGTRNVWTGSNLNGSLLAGDTCSDWSAAGTGYYADASYGSFEWISVNGTPCSQLNRLYCFQVDYNVDVTPAAPTGKIAFATPYTPTTGGISAVNKECQDAAKGRFTGTFLALVATSTQSPAANIGATDSSGWMRPDGVQVVAASADLLSTTPTLEAPISLTADGTYLGSYNVFSNSPTPLATAVTAAAACNDWTSTSVTPSSGNSGIANRTDSSFFGSAFQSSGLPCSYTNGFIYCLQQ